MHFLLKSFDYKKINSKIFFNVILLIHLTQTFEVVAIVIDSKIVSKGL